MDARTDNIDVDEGFDEELAAFLAEMGTAPADEAGPAYGAGPADAYRVEHVLKKSAYEVTELVSRADAAGAGAGRENAGAAGPQAGDAPSRLFVRKRILLDAQMGSAYERLFGVQRAGARLAHVPRIHECERSEDELVVVMEDVRGESLASLVEREGAGPALARTVFPKICSAVSELHEQLDPPLIHRDLKPSNIIIADGSDEHVLGAARAAGEPVIIDFGIARTWREGAEADTVRFGTRGYAAPEQFGFGQTSVRSDVYALGMLLYFCWTGREPRSGLDAEGLAAEGVPEKVAQVILHATAFDPAARYGSVVELGRAFRAALDGGNDATSGRDSGAKSVPAPAAAVVVPSAPASGIEAADGACAMGSRRGEEPGRREDGRGASSGAERSAAERSEVSTPARGTIRTLVSRIPAWVGRVWNVVVLCVWLFFAYSCVLCIVKPVGSDVARSIWFRILEYAFMILAFATAACWLALDKRRLRTRLLGPQGITPRMEHIACAVLAGISIAALLVVLLFGMG